GPPAKPTTETQRRRFDMRRAYQRPRGRAVRQVTAVSVQTALALGRGGELLFDDDVGDLVRRRVEPLAALADVPDRVVDLERFLARCLGVVALHFLGDVDEAARV